MSGLDLLFLSKEDIDSLDLSLQEIMDAVEGGLKAHGERQVILPPKDHLVLDFPEKPRLGTRRAVARRTRCPMLVMLPHHGAPGAFPGGLGTPS